ncbi:hypothetical protein ACROYT_G014387 [Oculina patagonica]
MFAVLLAKNIVKGLPLLNYQNVCTASPKNGKAFCEEHIDYLTREQPNIPTDIRGFLAYCGIQRGDLGNTEFIERDHAAVSNVLERCIKPKPTTCNKDTGAKQRLQKWSFVYWGVSGKWGINVPKPLKITQKQTINNRLNGTKEAYTAASCIGRQPDSDIWVFGEDLQLSGDGSIVEDQTLPFIWVRDVFLLE